MTFRELFDEVGEELKGQVFKTMDDVHYAFNSRIEKRLNEIMNGLGAWDYMSAYTPYGKGTQPTIKALVNRVNRVVGFDEIVVKYKINCKRENKHSYMYSTYYDYSFKGCSEIMFVGCPIEESNRIFETVSISDYLIDLYTNSDRVKEFNSQVTKETAKRLEIKTQYPITQKLIDIVKDLYSSEKYTDDEIREIKNVVYAESGVTFY